MYDQETREIVEQLIQQAQEDQHTQPHTLVTWQEFMFYRKQVKAYKVVINILQKSADNLFKSYCYDVIKGETEFSKVLAYVQLLDIVDYYQQEHDIVNEMVKEYDKYLEEGNLTNFICAIFGAVREI